MKAKNPLILASVAAALALAAGCGSSGSSNSSSTNTAAAAASTTAASPGSRYGAGGGASTTASNASAATVISVKHSEDGTILAAGPKHGTVYLFEADKGGKSACSGECARDWPPVTTSGQPQTSGAASSAKLGTTTRADGTKQVTYNGHPVYFFEKDTSASDANGQGLKAFGAKWYVLAPSGNKVDNDDEEHGGGDGS